MTSSKRYFQFCKTITEQNHYNGVLTCKNARITSLWKCISWIPLGISTRAHPPTRTFLRLLRIETMHAWSYQIFTIRKTLKSSMVSRIKTTCCSLIIRQTNRMNRKSERSTTVAYMLHTIRNNVIQIKQTSLFQFQVWNTWIWMIWFLKFLLALNLNQWNKCTIQIC